MKIYIDNDEYYPFWMISTKRNWSGELEAELSEADYKEYKRVMRAFEKWQTKIESLYEPITEIREER